MKVFQFNSAGLFIGETVADESPMEPGVFLLPARCTLTPPPGDCPAGMVPRWNGSAWGLVNLPNEEKPDDPLAKLQAFLNANPDVAGLLDVGTKG